MWEPKTHGYQHQEKQGWTSKEMDLWKGEKYYQCVYQKTSWASVCNTNAGMLVCMNGVPCILIGSTSECVFGVSRAAQLWIPCNFHTRSPAWVRTRCLESCFYTSDASSVCNRWWWDPGVEWMVRYQCYHLSSLSDEPTIDTIRFPPLDVIWSKNSPTMHQAWRNSQDEISKTYCRYVIKQ